MKFLKPLSTLLLLAFCADLNAQKKSAVKEYNIDCSNDGAYYIKAKGLTIYNPDSLFEAYRILKRLYHFDSTKYSKKFLSPDFSKIESINYHYLQTNIIGQWNFEWSGSNWGTSETSANKKARLVFTETEAFFYIADTLKRQTKYLITNKFESLYPKEIFFQLYFLDNKDHWDFSFMTKGADYIAHLKFDSQNIGLFINESPNCSCGCPESIYLKNGASNYVIGKGK
jgi:hypothetical protein